MAFWNKKKKDADKVKVEAVVAEQSAPAADKPAMAKD